MRSTRSLYMIPPTLNAAVGKWLVEEVMPTIESLESGRMGPVPLNAAFEGFHARIKEIAARK